MTLAKTYDPKSVEDKWYAIWQEQRLFHSVPDPDKKPYTVVIPPPNVTGVLHMGHMLNNTIQDILVRKARMEGKEACWVPGTDHASIATETKVVNMLQEQGIDKQSITRDEFLKHAWEWKEKYGGIILEQLKKLGASCDWEREAFTMDEVRSKSVIKVFVELYNKGLIYRGVRMVNWDPKGQTALSDEEVFHKEVDSQLHHVRYAIADSDEYVTIATTRPETILGDTALCVHPEDERYTHLHGKKAIVPLINREIPIITDEYVDPEFGTGCLKVTPAHDINDYELGIKHKLETIDILNQDGTLNEKATLLVGEDRFAARKKIVAQLKTSENYLKAEQIKNNVGYSERTGEVIEPRLSVQWFCKMKDMAEPALENVMNDTINIHPPKFKNMYRSWMENIRDWCISRQLWWGHRIPAWYLPDGDFVVGETAEEALQAAKEKQSDITLQDLKQDEDVLDTWFSSWLWPMSVFDGINNPDNEEFNYYYPTNTLVTGFDIIFFWVARMIMAGYEFKKELPFKDIYFTGMVRDDKGRKMSKQLGNSPNPLSLIDRYGADGVRVGMLLTAPAGNDLLFDEKLCEQGRNFTNKLWNAFRLIEGFNIESKPCENKLAITWMQEKLKKGIEEAEGHFQNFRMSDALMTLYKLAWDDFCSWYLEMIKPAHGETLDQETYEATTGIFSQLIKLLHPFMPFITEELWSHLPEKSKDFHYIVKASWPEKRNVDENVLQDVAYVQEVVSGLRNIRKNENIPFKTAIDVVVKTSHKALYDQYEGIISKLTNIASLSYANEKVEKAISVVIKSDELFVPLNEDVIDVEAQREKIQKELDYTKGFLKSVDKKLSNERFVQNAPEKVVELEKKKQEDAQAKIKALEESLQSL